MANQGMKDLRGAQRRDFIRWIGAAGAALALERSKVLNYLLDEGGSALADPAACATTNRSVHIIGGNGSEAWFQLLWPHLEVVSNFSNSFAYHAPNEGMLYTEGDKPLYYGPEAPWMVNGKPSRPVTALMAGENETHTQTPDKSANVAGNASMIAACAALQRVDPSLLPVIGVGPVKLGDAPGAPPIATVPDAQGIIELFNSAASQLTLKAQEDQAIYETYYKALVGLRYAAGSPSWRRHLEITKKATSVLGTSLAAALSPTQADLDAYGITALNSSSAGVSAQQKLTNFGRGLISTAKAMKLGLTNCVVLGMSPGPVSEQVFVDPHVAFNDMTRLRDTVKALGAILNGFYADLAATPDPTCSGKNLDQSVIMTLHGDTPHDPLVRAAWPDATPGNSNWLYVMGNGYLKNGWFGGVRANTAVDGWDPTTGETIPGTPAKPIKSADTTYPACAAVLYAVAKGDIKTVNEIYKGPAITGVIK